jgi:hypothetical protein
VIVVIACGYHCLGRGSLRRTPALRPFRTWLEAEPQVRSVEREGVLYRVAPVAAVDLTIGLAIETTPGKLEPSDPHERFHSEGATHYAGRDGLLVEVGPLWSPENMTKEPQERT